MIISFWFICVCTINYTFEVYYPLLIDPGIYLQLTLKNIFASLLLTWDNFLSTHNLQKSGVGSNGFSASREVSVFLTKLSCLNLFQYITKASDFINVIMICKTTFKLNFLLNLGLTKHSNLIFPPNGKFASIKIWYW